MRARLAAGLRAAAADVLGEDGEVPVSFDDIPKGFGFRGGEPSTTSLVNGAIVGGVSQEVREELMRRICDMWTEVSGATVDELVVSARDV